MEVGYKSTVQKHMYISVQGNNLLCLPLNKAWATRKSSPTMSCDYALQDESWPVCAPEYMQLLKK